MNFKIINTIIAREYTAKVRKKSFLVTTLLVPVVLAVGLFIMVSIMAGMKPRSQEVVVVDRSGFVMPYLQNDGSNVFHDLSGEDSDKLKSDLKDHGMDVLLVVSEPDGTNSVSVQAYSHKPLNVDFSIQVNSYINKAIEDRRIESHRAEVENLGELIESIKSNVALTEFLLDDSGNESISESGVYMTISMIFGVFIFLFITMFGGMVMSSVIEEKSSRVVEVLISSVKTTELMFGKIIGVALVAFTQFVLWIALTVVIFIFGSSLLGVGISSADTAAMMDVAAGDLQAMPGGDMAVMMSTLVKIPWGTMITAFVIYFVLGYLLYSSMFAAIGSAVENEGDTQQLQLPLTIPLMIGYMIVFFAFKNPDSGVVVWGSMIPFTSPIVMLARIPYGVPAGELVASVLILLVTFVAMAWISAKIYKVGILMYGKKSSYRDLWNWLKQK